MADQAEGEALLDPREKRRRARRAEVDKLYVLKELEMHKEVQYEAEVIQPERHAHLAFEARSFLCFLLTFVAGIFLSVPGLEGLGLTRGTRQLLIHRALPSTVSLVQKTFADVGNIDELNNYIEYTLFNATYDLNDSGYLSRYNFVIGGVRIRQLRVQSDEGCSFSYGWFWNHRTYESPSSGSDQWGCRHNWEFGSEQKADFVGASTGNTYSWTDAATNGNTVFGGDAVLTSGLTQIEYPGSGYVVDLGTNRDTAYQRIKELQADAFFDSTLTAAVVLEFSTYNPSVYLHHNVRLLFERNTAGALLPSAHMGLMRIYRYPTEDTTRMISFALDAINTLYIVYFVAVELHLMFHPDVKKIMGVQDDLLEAGGIRLAGADVEEEVTPLWQRPLYYCYKLLDGWELLHLANVILFVMVLTGNVRWYLTSAIYNYSLSASTTTFQNLAPMLEYYRNLKNVNAFNVLLSFLKLFKFTKLNASLNMLWLTLTKSSLFLFGYVVMLLLIFLGLALMAHTVFGTVIFQYTYLTFAISTLLQALQNSISMPPLMERSPMVAPIFFFTFAFLVFFVLLNLFIAVLNKSFIEVSNALNAREKDGKFQTKNHLATLCGECAIPLAKAVRQSCQKTAEEASEQKSDDEKSPLAPSEDGITVEMPQLDQLGSDPREVATDDEADETKGK
eukprot:TRINITY_DN14962_c0_g1_i1.p1 TRINITY_DN14962_c0_g1~~TRINITY_DN14962_c0_g1_i1.p1  ORF type:complete len:675 (-),score=165.31 TRINITY_DN14962_c0_g1_i1:250-2274(-)